MPPPAHRVVELFFTEQLQGDAPDSEVVEYLLEMLEEDEEGEEDSLAELRCGADSRFESHSKHWQWAAGQRGLCRCCPSRDATPPHTLLPKLRSPAGTSCLGSLLHWLPCLHASSMSWLSWLGA